MASVEVQHRAKADLRRWLIENASTLILPAICLLPVLLGLPFLNEPFDRDEGAYATIAQGVLRGDLPYRDYFDHKPPLVYVWYAAGFFFFGESVVAPRLMAALAWALTTLVVYKQTLLLANPRVARSAALLFALSSGLVLLQANANTEVFMLLPLTLSLYALTKAVQGGGVWWVFVTGVSGAIAALTKQVAIVNLIVAGLVLAGYCLRNGDLRRTFASLAPLAIGAAVVGVLALLPYLLSDSLDDFVYANWTYNRLYGAEISLAERIDAQITGDRFFLTVAAPLVLLALVGFLSVLRGKASGGLLVVGWLLASYGGLLLSGRAFPHYYVGLLPPLAILAAVGLASWRVPSRPMLVFKPILVLGAFLCFVLNVSVFLESTPQEKHTARFSHETGVQLSFNLASNSYTEIDLAKHNDSPKLAAYIRSITSKSDTIYNFGRETQLYFYANRRPATRFIYDRSFLLDPPTFEAAMLELTEAPPEIIIDTVGSRSSGNWNDSHPGAIRHFLALQYDYLGQVEFADVYQLKQTR